jgi:formylglycine-generating enzyme required for sulfatase activity
MPFRQHKPPKIRTQYFISLPLCLVIAIIIHQKFGAESFSHHSFNRTKILVLRNLAETSNLYKQNNSNNNNSSNINSNSNIFFLKQQAEEDSKLILRRPEIAVTMEEQYKYLMEDLRKDLLQTIPSQLLEASNGSKNSNPNHTDSDLDKAMEFLDAHSRPGKNAAWKQNLEKFVALKEASRALQNTKSPPDFPQGLMEKLLEKQPKLMEEMLLADGPSGGNYGKAMEIYEEISNESDCVDDSDLPILHRLAVAVALVHATPVVQTNPLEPKDGNDNDDPANVVDPTLRYLNYEAAYLEGELDPAFDTLTIWELRFVVDGDEPDEIASWGRETLRNFYPDHALERKPDWLYAGIVRSDIPYGSSRVKDDDPKLHKYQNILRNGGICGRRAFFGRFILRAFGIPTTARPSKGHAALCHWKPDGEWVVNLGGGFGAGWTKTRYVKDLDFEAVTKARNHPKQYETVKLAQWIGELFDETPVYGIHDESGIGRGSRILLDLQKKSDVGLWYRISLKVQESILASHKNRGARKTKGDCPVENIVETACQQKSKAGSCSSGKDRKGRMAIRIPASSYSDPKKTKEVKIMKGIENPTDEDAASTTHRADEKSSGNQQIYLPSFQPQGTTIMRGGTWKEGANDRCNSGGRLLSGGRGRYEDWGLRAAMTLDDGEEEETGGWVVAPASCPEPEITLAVGGDSSITMEFVYIPPGKFVMGGESTKDGKFTCLEVPHHPVELTRGFYLGKYPVTQEQYAAVMKGKNPSKSTKDPKCPVDCVGVDDAVGFCESSSEATGSNIRLPTEAEWEYASRGSTNGTSADPQWFFGSDISKLDDYAWHKDNSGKKSHPVGLKKPNPFGLYDVYGNVCERVSDTYLQEYYAQGGKGGVMVDPTGPSQGTKSRLKYEVKNVPETGKYFLTARVCTINPKQNLRVSTTEQGDDNKGVILKLPYTVGGWKDSEPVPVQLKKGENTLHFWRDAPPQYGISIKEFVLTKAN